MNSIFCGLHGDVAVNRQTFAKRMRQYLAHYCRTKPAGDPNLKYSPLSRTPKSRTFERDLAFFGTRDVFGPRYINNGYRENSLEKQSLGNEMTQIDGHTDRSVRSQNGACSITGHTKNGTQVALSERYLYLEVMITENPKEKLAVVTEGFASDDYLIYTRQSLSPEE